MTELAKQIKLALDNAGYCSPPNDNSKEFFAILRAFDEAGYDIELSSRLGGEGGTMLCATPRKGS